MKTLEKFSGLKVSAAEQELVNGGAPVHASWTSQGTKYTFDGEVNQTLQVDVGAQFYTEDYCGKASVDGAYTHGCHDFWP
jgi:hypothetical protein